MPSIRCIFSGVLRRSRRVIAAAALLSLSGAILLSSAWRHSVSHSPLTYGTSARLAQSSTSPSGTPLDVAVTGPSSNAPPASPPDGLHSTFKSAPPSRVTRLHVVLHWTANFDNGFTFRLDSESFSGCPESACVATNNRSRLQDADAVLFHGRAIKLSDLPAQRRPEQLFVFALRESPQATHLDLQKLDGFFNLTMTYSRGADVFFPYAETVAGEQDGVVPYFHRRRRPVSWLVSHCVTHSRRERYVAQLQRHLPVDSFGSCGRQRCPGSRLDCYHRLAASHLFYLAFENSLCEDYITEKFWLALRVGLVPVVRGADPEAYRRVAPPHSFIHVDDFAGPTALAAYLLSLARNRTAYSAYHAWRATHRVQPPRSLCDLCARLGQHGQRGQHGPVQLAEVWAAKTHCVAPRDLDGR